jgi:hypothetical protein
VGQRDEVREETVHPAGPGVAGVPHREHPEDDRAERDDGGDRASLGRADERPRAVAGIPWDGERFPPADRRRHEGPPAVLPDPDGARGARLCRIRSDTERRSLRCP